MRHASMFALVLVLVTALSLAPTAFAAEAAAPAPAPIHQEFGDTTLIPSLFDQLIHQQSQPMTSTEQPLNINPTPECGAYCLSYQDCVNACPWDPAIKCVKFEGQPGFCRWR